MTFFITMFLLLNFVYGEVASDAVKNVHKVRSLSSLFTKDQNLRKELNVEQASKTVTPPSRVRQMIMKRESRDAKSILTKSDLMGTWKPTKLEKTLIIGEYDTLKIIPGEQNQVSYTAGETIVIMSITNEPIRLEFFIDNGDGVFGDGDRIVPLYESEGEPILEDGGIMDETPAGDGVILFHLNTTEITGGPDIFLALQGVKLWIVGVQVNSGVHSFTYVDVSPISSATNIQGSVLLGDNSPAPFQLVAAVIGDSSDFDEPNAIVVTLTDAQGNYFLGIPDYLRGQFMLVLTMDWWRDFPGLWPSPAVYEMVLYGQMTGINFTLLGGTAKITGYVWTNNKTPVANVEVVAKMWDNEMSRATAMTDVNGYYEIIVPPGTWEVNINQESLGGNYLASGYYEPIDLQDGQTANRDFTLYPCDGFFSGTVRYASGAPVMGANVFAEIWVQDQFGFYTGYWVETKTDESGNYLLSVSKALQTVSPGDTNFYYVGAWYEDAIIMPGGYNVLADAAGLDFTVLNANVTLAGTVSDKQNQMPVLDAAVRAFSLNKDGVQFENWSWTDQNGYFEMALVGDPQGILYAIEVYWPNSYRPALYDTLLAFSDQTYFRRYEIEEVQAVGSVEGWVYDNQGYSINGALVEFMTPTKAYFSVTTDEYGYYRINEIPADRYYVKASAPGYFPQEFWAELGPWSNRLDFWLSREAIKLSGVVRDAANNNPLGRSLVFLTDQWDYYLNGIFTDDQGYFEFQVEPGFYNLVAGHNDYWVTRIDSLFIDGPKNEDIFLQKATIVGNINGHVVDVNYAPIQNAWIYVESANYIGYANTDQAGWYEIPLPEGEFQAWIGAEGYHEENRWFSFPGGGLEEPIMLFGQDNVYGPKLVAVVDIPQDQGKQVRLTWRPDPNFQSSVKEFQIWRAVQPADGPDPQIGVQYTWDFVATVPFHQEFVEYNYVAPTLYDKVGENVYWTAFMVTAVAWDEWTFWDSNIKAGWSEDNLAPEVPKSLSGNMDGGQIVLKWEEVTSEEVKYYTVYRKVGAGDFNQYAYTTKPEFIDTDISATDVYTYMVSATDFGLNESEKSAPAVVVIVATADEKRVPEQYSLAQNFPNPFNPTTKIAFGLPKNSDVTLTIYNLMGQIVREYRMQLPAGYGQVVWDGCDNFGNQVGSGVYIYTIATKEFKQTRKMVLMR
jgi:hypothetical protein